jgi:V/A-type H+/Na+-transporting ATPase subunit I
VIIDVQKTLFVGVQDDIEIFFERAQSHGFIEFIPGSKKKGHQPTPAIERLSAALKILRKLPKLKQDERRGNREEALQIAGEIVQLKEEVEKVQEAIRVITAEIVRVAPLGDFSVDDLEFIQQHGRVVQFFCMKSSKREGLKDSDDLIYLNTEYDLDYYMSIAPRPIHPVNMVEMKVEQPASFLKEQAARLRAELHEAEAKLKEKAKSMLVLHEVLIDELNEHHLEEAKDEVSHPIDNSLFTVEAWVPKNKLTLLFGMLQGLAVHAEPILAESEDRVPTYMENKGLGKVGEDLVLIYDVPATTDKDPSLWVLWSFSLFFAMIIADAGYGLLFLCLALFLQYKMPRIKSSGRRLIKLITLLSVTCIAWGILTTAYFGISILPQNPLSKVSIVSFLAEKKAEYHLQHDDHVYHELIKSYPDLQKAKNGKEMLAIGVLHGEKRITYPVLDEFRGSILLEISLLVGVLHIGCAFIRYARKRWAGIGWLIFMVGGYLYFPSYLQTVSLVNYLGWISAPVATAVGLQMIYIGIGLAMLLALIQKRLGGLMEVMNVITVFGDVLSYLRLYALALASTIMADTFNEIGIEVGLALGCLVILAGHIINLSLATMGGVIHGLRLNYVEWYHYAFDGGGKLFAPLQKLKK